MTPTKASDIGIRQAENITHSILIDRYSFSNEKIIRLLEKLDVLSAELIGDPSKQAKVMDWASKHNLIILPDHTDNMLSREKKILLQTKLKSKATTFIFYMYVLKYDFRFTYKKLDEFKAFVDSRQGFVDKKYITYQDIYDVQRKRGIKV